MRAYTVRSKRWQRLSELPNWQDMATMSDVDTSIIALANYTDMNLSGEMRFTGRTDAADGAALSKAHDICQVLGVPGMAEVVKLQSNSGELARIPRKYHPKGSVRIEGANFVDMVNPSFFQLQNSNPVAGSRPRRFFASVRSFLKSWD